MVEGLIVTFSLVILSLFDSGSASPAVSGDGERGMTISCCKASDRDISVYAYGITY